ncbi:Protein TOXD [Cyberlindnera fabianii]|uniref:Protein TOXD n=1 Tax=Cyberlindnera fabianii TaxID=36022 RepID=A0A1V2KZQ1_CYBFA|nr:Protein TOXD [Cyberlindnera fabianii]
MSSNTALVIADSPVDGKWATTTSVPYPSASDDQLIVKTLAYAANPTDWKHIDFKQGSAGDITGSDAAGIVEKVGKNVTGFKEGDVVSVFAHGNYNKTRGCFADYIIADPSTTIKHDAQLKESLPVGEYRSGPIDSFAGAASVTLGLSTVVLSFASNLNIKDEDKGKYILIWGGATATGILAIQIATKGFGLKVATTASKKHHEYLKSLGADVVVDYNDSDAVEQIKKATGSDIRYGFDTVSEPETWQSLYDATANSPKVVLDNLLFLSSDKYKADGRSGEVTVAPGTLAYVATGERVKVFGGDFDISPEAFDRYKKFWFEKLPTILKDISHAKLKVLAPGYESANEAWGLLKHGKVSGEKVVFHKK